MILLLASKHLTTGLVSGCNLHVEHITTERYQTSWSHRTRAILLRSIFNELNKDEVSALFWGKLADNPHSLVCQMHVILQKPRTSTLVRMPPRRCWTWPREVSDMHDTMRG